MDRFELSERSARRLGPAVRWVERQPKVETSKPKGPKLDYAPPAATGYVGGTFGLLVCGVTTSGVVSVYTIDGDLVWSATVMTHGSGQLHDVLFGQDAGVHVLSGDEQSYATADSSGGNITAIANGYAGLNGQIAGHGLAKTSAGIYRANCDGTGYGQLCATGPTLSYYGSLAATGYFTNGAQVNATDSGYVTITGITSAKGGLWDSSGTLSLLGAGNVPSGGTYNVCAMDNTTDTLWSVAIEAGVTQIRKVVLSTNTHSYVTTGTGSATTFAWIPPWGTRLYYGDTTTIQTHNISTAPPQLPTMVSAGGNIRKLAGGWANGRKYCVIASASGLSFNDSLGQVWSKAGNFSGCDFLGTSPAY